MHLVDLHVRAHSLARGDLEGISFGGDDVGSDQASKSISMAGSNSRVANVLIGIYKKWISKAGLYACIYKRTGKGVTAYRRATDCARERD